jgi:hypothetical protein
MQRKTASVPKTAAPVPNPGCSTLRPDRSVDGLRCLDVTSIGATLAKFAAGCVPANTVHRIARTIVARG